MTQEQQRRLSLQDINVGLQVLSSVPADGLVENIRIKGFVKAVNDAVGFTPKVDTTLPANPDKAFYVNGTVEALRKLCDIEQDIEIQGRLIKAIRKGETLHRSLQPKNAEMSR